LAEDQVSFQATWKPDTLVLDLATVQGNLLNPTTADGIYRFAPSLAEVGTWQPEQVVVLSGVDIVKVLSVETQADAIIVTTKPISLVTAVTDADVSWDIGVDMAQGTPTPQVMIVGGADLIGASPGGQERIAAIPSPVDKMSYQGPLGNLTAKQTMSFNADGSLKMELEVSFKDGNTTLKVVGTGTVHSFRHSGDVSIRGGTLLSGYVDVKDVDLDLDLNIGAVALGKSDDTFKLPVQITAPAHLGPIPVYVGLGASLSLNPLLSDTSSSRTHVHFHLKGGGGFKIIDGKANSYGSLEAVEVSAKENEAVSTVNAGLGVLLEFPKVTFGVGIAKVAAGEVFTSVKTEMVANQTMRYDGMGLITGNCLEINGNYGIFAGGTVRLAGVSLTKEMQVWGKVDSLYKAGNPDQSVCP
jgi:hypothetical protein